jgi:peptide/nickel transport system substrate-binding protein
MDNRFTLKDFVFFVLFVIVLGAVLWASFQFSYQEQRLNDVKRQLTQLDDTQKQQLAVLSEIRNQLKNGIALSTNAGSPETAGRIRRKNPDGSQYVYYPQPPRSPRDPLAKPDYAAGDWLVLNLSTEPKVLTPYTVKDYSGQLAQSPVLESLASQNPETFDWEPWLAESFEISADGLTYQFKIRPQACFSDGKPLRADDVVFSYNTIMNPDVDCAPLRGYYDHVKSCQKIDDLNVVFKMDQPYFLAMDFLGGMSIIPRHVYTFTKGEEFNKMGDVLVGSGPYRVEKWSRGQQYSLVRNDKYWADPGTFNRVIFHFIGNPQAALQSFLNGELDEFPMPTADQFYKFAEDPDFLKKFIVRKYPRPNSGFSYLGYNEKHPQFTDKATRRALTMLIDRKSIIHTIVRDLAMEITGPFNPMTLQHDPTIQPLAYDPDAAKKLLADAGWKPGADGVLTRNGVRFEFDLSMGKDNPQAERIANYIKEQFERAGIRMRITPWEFAVLMDRLDERNYDAVLMGWSGAIEDDPYQIWHSSSIADKGSNFINFVNKESDALIEEARRTLDKDKRMELWHKWERLVYDEQPYTFMYAPQDRAFINNRFKNTEAYKTGLNEYDWYVPLSAQKYK